MSKKKRLKTLFSHWVMEPTPENILFHLHEKTEAFRTASAFSGETNPAEKQLIEHVTSLRQQVLILTDVIQALLIIEDERLSQKMKRAFMWVLGGVRKLWRKVNESTLYRILGLAGSIAFLLGILVWLFHRFWHLSYVRYMR